MRTAKTITITLSDAHWEVFEKMLSDNRTDADDETVAMDFILSDILEVYAISEIVDQECENSMILHRRLTSDLR